MVGATLTPVFSPALAGEMNENARAACGEYIFTFRETLKGFV